MLNLSHDLRVAGRTLVAAPAFPAIAIATLSLGIGLSTAIFSVVNGLLLKPLPFPDPDRLVLVREIDASGRLLDMAEPTFSDIASRVESFSALGYSAGSYSIVVTGGSEPVRSRISYASARFFEVLGVNPMAGRAFLPEETRYGGPVAVLVSYGFWQRLLGGRADFSTVRLSVDGISSAVVGVMPPSFNYPPETDVWLTRSAEPPNPSRAAHSLVVIGRLRAGIGVDQAQAELTTLARRLRRTLGEATDAVDLALVPPQKYLTRNVSEGLWLLLAAVGLLLLVACANVSNLLLARFAGRRREFALRRALGATRWRLARQLTVENLLVTVPAAALGVFLASLGVNVLLRLESGTLPRINPVGVDERVVVIVGGLSLLIALALAVMPFSKAGAEVAVPDLTAGARGQSSDPAMGRARGATVMAQIAVTFVLLVCATLLGRGFLMLVLKDPGFNPEGAIVMTLALPTNVTPQGDEQLRQFYTRLLERLGQLPGVLNVGGINALPLTGQGRSGTFLIDGHPSQRGVAHYRVASAGYFGAMGIPLLRGRFFDRGDTVNGQHVAVISQSLAQQSWPNQDPLGQQIQFSMDTDRHLLHIVGVVGDVNSEGLDADPHPTVYAYSLQRPQWWQVARLSVVVRTQRGVAALTPAMRAAVQELRSDVPVSFRTLSQVASSSLDQRRFSLVLFAVFSGAALLIATLGVYAAISYTVSQRTRELGIRIALGAGQADVMALVLGQGMRLALTGVVVGFLCAAASTRLMRHLVYGVSTSDPLTLATVALLLILVALIACWIPARRAVEVEPLAAIRTE